MYNILNRKQLTNILVIIIFLISIASVIIQMMMYNMYGINIHYMSQEEITELLEWTDVNTNMKMMDFQLIFPTVTMAISVVYMNVFQMEYYDG